MTHLIYGVSVKLRALKTYSSLMVVRQADITVGENPDIITYQSRSEF
jgi:hypothetical protein